MSNKHTHSDAAWNIAYEIHSKDYHKWDKDKFKFYRNCERNGAPYPWLTEELDVIENTLLYLGLQDQPDPQKWVEEHKELDAIDVNPKDTKAMVDKIFEADKLEKENIAQLQAENERLKELVKSFEQPLHLLNQLVQGWKNTTPAQEWSEFDEETYQGLVKMQIKTTQQVLKGE
jgi:hypothetical protein